ncbi:MAG TPA: hypothetical protein VGM81_01030 [Burkholderiaceae bacterium]
MKPNFESHQADPFGEHQPAAFRRELSVLGARFEFLADAPELLDLVDQAYAGLPAQVLKPAPLLQVRLRLMAGEPSLAGLGERPEPPLARMQGGAGFFGAVMDAENLSWVCPSTRSALVSFSPELSRFFPYHARYELLEFAVFTLACRTQQLVPLHAGCVGLNGVGALLVGESGAGKSTLSAHAFLQGLDFLTEDAAFVEPESLRTAGVANFLHLRSDALPFFEDAAVRDWIQHSPVIRRRSGVEKFEIDMRDKAWGRVAPTTLKLGAVIFITKQPTGDGQALVRLAGHTLAERLAQSQPYAAQQPGWSGFAEQVSHLAGFELRRGPHPGEAARALRQALQDLTSAP